MKISAIQTGTVAIKPSQQRGDGHGLHRRMHVLFDGSWTGLLPIYAWVIEHPEGLIVVDTGETSRTSEPHYFTRWHPYFKLAVKAYVQPSDEIGPQLQKIGYDPRDVRWLVLTHLHTDHAGGLHHFPTSEILVSSTEYKLASGLRGKLRGYLPQRWPAWFKPTLIDFSEVADGAEHDATDNTIHAAAHGLVDDAACSSAQGTAHGQAYGAFPNSHVLTKAGDVVLVPTPGHTYGHLSVIVRDGPLSYFLAGDTSYNQDLMLQQAIDGVAPSEPLARLTLSRIIQFAHDTPTVYLPSHDPQSVLRLENRTTVFQ